MELAKYFNEHFLGLMLLCPNVISFSQEFSWSVLLHIQKT